MLAARVVYADPDFAVLRYGDAEWMLHADHSYSDHPLRDVLSKGELRGIGAEIRFHGRDPDQAESEARKAGHAVIAASKDKRHGLREVHILDPDDYCWVLDVPSDVIIVRSPSAS